MLIDRDGEYHETGAQSDERRRSLIHGIQPSSREHQEERPDTLGISHDIGQIVGIIGGRRSTIAGTGRYPLDRCAYDFSFFLHFARQLLPVAVRSEYDRDPGRGAFIFFGCRF